MNWDYQLFKYINDMANNHTVFGKLMVAAADKGDVFFVISLLAIFSIRRKMSVYGFIAAACSVAVSRSISLLYFRDRPFAVHEVNQLLPHVESNSFPSDHAAAAFAIAFMLFLCSKRLGVVMLTCAGIVSFSRIWVGKHYPLDVFAGALLGILVAVLVFWLLERTGIFEWLAQRLKSFRRAPAEPVEIKPPPL